MYWRSSSTPDWLTENALAALPVKLRKASVPSARPLVGTGLELTDGLSQGDGAAQQKERVDVLGLGVDFDRDAAHPIECAAHASMEVRSSLIGEAAFPMFSGEDQVGIEFSKRLWHSLVFLAPFQGA